MGTTTQTTLDVQPNPLHDGGQAEVSITDGPTNETVTVHVSDGGAPPHTDEIKVDLDANGDGTSKWDVPDWDHAIFTYDGLQVTRPIV